MTKMKRIIDMEEQERQLVRGNMNGRNDTALYNLRKKLDVLLRKENKLKKGRNDNNDETTTRHG